FWVLGVGVRVCIDNNHKRLRRAFFKLFSRSEPLPSRRRYTGRAKPTLRGARLSTSAPARTPRRHAWFSSKFGVIGK
ncbi:MAG TPA: hypothetical protein VFG23_05350, partial [Polyangia bacterium]|nr:hypothetical protein [Polyangia bacterium]